MATSIRMPQLGESVTEGTVTRWLIQEGQWVKRDEPLVEVMTDKVNAEIPSPVAGLLVKIRVAEGEKVAVGEELAAIEEREESQTVSGPAGQAAGTLRAGAGSSEAAAREVSSLTAVANGASQDGQGRYSPLVRRLAREHGIDLSLLQGTGIGGRVTKDDVLNYLDARHRAASVRVVAVAPTPRAVSSQSPAAQTPISEQRPAASEHVGEVVTPSPMRLAIAEHMLRSAQTVPHAWTMVEVDMTSLVRWREQIREEFERRDGVRITFLPFVVQAVVAALKELPIMNSEWADNKIVLKKQINVGIAVALDDGLIVPVVHNADQLSITGLAKVVSDLSARARAGRLTPADVQGGTFTVNNPGAFGSIVSMPIINQGQAGILAMEAIVKRPVVIDDAIAIRSMMHLGLSFDHRSIDGATAGRFLQSIKRRLEAYGPGTAL